HIDMALLDCATGVLANQAMNYLATGIAPRRLGNAHPNIAPYQTFATADEPFILAVGNDEQFAWLCAIIGPSIPAEDPRFVGNAARVANRVALSELIQAECVKWRRDDLLAALEANAIPAGPVNTLADVFADPQVLARRMRIRPGGIPGLRTPITMSGAELALDLRAPRLGEHAAEIHAELATRPSGGHSPREDGRDDHATAT
ncbi:MAG: CoA transferase, partial [Devosia sp.]